MAFVTSKDGTSIGYTKYGSGPAIVFVDGALNYRAMHSSEGMAKLLEDSFTVYVYDRRGKGESGDTIPYSVDREIEDLEAIIDEAGGSVYLVGFSSGAGLVLEATNKFPDKVKKIMVYEAPFFVDHSREFDPDFLGKVKQLAAEDKRSDILKLFFSKGIQMPWFVIFMMQFSPMWPKMKAIAHTMVYDFSIMSPYEQGNPLPRDRWTNVTMPALVGVGGKSPEWMKNSMKDLNEVLPNTEFKEFEGQDHMAKPEAIAPAIKEFFSK